MTAWSTAATVNQLVTATSGQLGPKVETKAGGCKARQEADATALASKGCQRVFSFKNQNKIVHL